MARALPRLAYSLALALFLVSAVVANEREDHIRRLVEQVARGDEIESAAARQRLIDELTQPLLDAIGTMDQRPAAEQLRVRSLLAGLASQLRIRLLRLDLPPEDRALFDQFAEVYPELTQRLFHDDYRIRMAAVNQVPLEANSGAGVMIAAKVNDEDEYVAERALLAARSLHDAVVARNLARFVTDATKTIESGFYGPESHDLARTVAIIVHRSIEVIGDAHAADGEPIVADALRYFGQSAYWDHYQRARAITALGRLGRPASTPLLLCFLDDNAIVRLGKSESGQRISQTVGDVAALSLSQIFDLKPPQFELEPMSGDPDVFGYRDNDKRRAGLRELRIWLERRGFAASQPATAPRSIPPASGEDDE